MPWLRSGDNAATYPSLLQVAARDDSDDRLVNEVAGFLWRCAMQSAGHMTDYEIDMGTAMLMGQSRTVALLEVAHWAGLMAPVPESTPERWCIVDDPEFIGIRLKEAVQWERQRDRDRKNPDLTLPVRARDGDSCRYCGTVVNFKAKSGKRSGTYEHLDPGQPADVDTYVVACRGCNSARKDGDPLPLLPVPSNPYYHPETIGMLTKHGLDPARPRTQREDAPGDPTPSGGTRPAERAAVPQHQGTAPTDGPAHPRTQREDAHSDPTPSGGTPPAASVAHPQQRLNAPPAETAPNRSFVNRSDSLVEQGGFPVGSGREGTGKDGTGRAGQGRDGPGQVRSGARRRGGRRRRRRGGG